MEISDGVRVRDLLSHLEISESQGVIVSVDARLKKPDDKLGDGVLVSVFLNRFWRMTHIHDR